MALADDFPMCLWTGFSCNDTVPKCRNPSKFSFPPLWEVTDGYRNRCASGPWLFQPTGVARLVPEGEGLLTNEICEFLAGDSWTRYSNADIWNRLTNWKFPLFQLISNSPRPPLGFWEEAFTIVHLLGDPQGTITDLLRKIDSCQIRAVFWKNMVEDGELRDVFRHSHGPHRSGQERLWKALALIVISYDEWGLDRGDLTKEYLLNELNPVNSEMSDDDREKFVKLCLKCASHLAADRATKFLPVIVAQGIFIGSVAVAIIRTKSLAEMPNPQTYINIEMYSIGFTALYFWVISVVILTSVIGTSQTANAIPNILEAFREKLIKEFPQRQHTNTLPENSNDEERCYRGGIYSWQPKRALKDSFENAAAIVEWVRKPTVPRMRQGRAVRIVLSLLIIPFGTIVGMILTSYVPPEGWSCRSKAELGIFAMWLVSYPFTLIPWGQHYRRRFWFTFAKDFIAMGATLGLVIATQIGIFNKCSCYTRDGATGLILPQNWIAKRTLAKGLGALYPALTGLGIGAQLLVFPAIVGCRYYEAIRVFLQRDDGESNAHWLHNICSWTWWMAQRRRFIDWVSSVQRVYNIRSWTWWMVQVGRFTNWVVDNTDWVMKIFSTRPTEGDRQLEDVSRAEARRVENGQDGIEEIRDDSEGAEEDDITRPLGDQVEA